ncbi:MAG: SIS domain-containing protein [Candidatus Sumerlaeia bacterium]|nr:SIS domain-containing protein [Candidatus Sumerlaeia bacterium]
MGLLGIRITAERTTVTLFEEDWQSEATYQFESKGRLTLDDFCEELIHAVAIFRNQRGSLSLCCLSLCASKSQVSHLSDWLEELFDLPAGKTMLGQRLSELFASPVFFLPEAQAAILAALVNSPDPQPVSALFVHGEGDLLEVGWMYNGRLAPIPGNLFLPATAPDFQGHILGLLSHLLGPSVIYVLEGHHTLEIQRITGTRVQILPREVLEVNACSMAALHAGYQGDPTFGPSVRVQLLELLHCGEQLLRSRQLVDRIDLIARHVVECLMDGCKVLTCGNGGSATDAAHLAEELVGKYRHVRRSFPAINLCADSSTLTCIGNDFGFDSIFSRQVEGYGEYGDVLIAFSTSGNSENIVRALHAAKTKKVFSIAILGRDGGRALPLADLALVVPSNQSERIQEYHTLILHAICEAVEFKLGQGGGA